MTHPHLTARARLTLLYTALFATGGAVLVGVTYVLVANSLHTSGGTKPLAVDSQFLAQCAKAKQDTGPNAANLRTKCAAAFAQGVKAGAQAQRDVTLHHLLLYSVIALAAVVVLAGVAGWLLAGRILRPVHQLTAAAREAGEHNLSRRLALTGPRDELRELADTFDNMLARLETAFTSQSRFIANASHELRTPLTLMRTTLDVVLDKPDASRAELIAMGTDVRSEVDHANALIDTLLALARNERGLTVHENVDLGVIAEDVLDCTRADGLRVSTTLAPAAVSGDPLLLERLVANLVDNAVRYNVVDGSVAVTTSATDDQVAVRVVNTGPVVAPERVAELFQPFTRLDDRVGNGFGLGLALVASIAAAHDASITATSREDGGLDITVRMRSTVHDGQPGHAAAATMSG